MPEPGADRISRRPPSSRARSSIEVSPRWRERTSALWGSNPTPSSRTSTVTTSGRWERRTVNVIGAGVAHGVVQRLVGDSQDRELALPVAVRTRGWGGSLDLEVDLDPVDAGEHLELLAQGAREAVALELGRAEAEDQRAQLVERLAGQLACPLELRAGGVGVAIELRGGGLGGEHHAEQLLADHVVELQGQPVAFGDDRQLAAALVEPRIGDRDRRVRCEQLDHGFVVGVEGCAALLLGQVEGADDAVGGHDRNAQERAHVRVAFRPPPAKARVLVDVLGPVRGGGVEHRAEHPVRARQRTHRGDQLIAHPRHQETAEAALSVGDPQSGIPCIGELASAVDQPLQHLLDRQLRGHGEHRVAHRLQCRAKPLLDHVAHNRERCRASGTGPKS